MTRDPHQTSTAKRASAVLIGLLFAGLFAFPLSDTLGYVIWALAPVAAVIEALGYPVAMSRIAEAVGDIREARQG